MFGFLIARLLQTLAMLLVMSGVVFTGVYLVGDPMAIYIGPQMTAELIARTRQELGFDQPLIVQYWRFLCSALQGDLGTSLVYNEPAIRVILQRIPATFELATVAMVIAVVLGVPLGLYAGMWPKRLSSRLIMGLSILGFSIPSFWLALMLVMVFAVNFGWLPTAGRGAVSDVLGVPLSILTIDGWRHLAMPAINMALFPLALIIRLTRSGVAENLRLDYVRFARAKGIAPARILLLHVLKNIAVPIVTVTGLSFGMLLAFAVVTESVFAWPGMGKLIIDAINTLDRPVVVAYILVTLLIFSMINLLVDLAYAVLDPRVRLSAA
jgi:peptide/nickel transport system permease protein